MQIRYEGYKDAEQVRAALAAAGFSDVDITTARGSSESDPSFVHVVYPSALDSSQQAQAAAAVAGVDTWTLAADGTSGASDITITGPDAACAWTVWFEGEEIASETDESAPFAVVLAAPVTAGTYRIRAVATDGTATGETEIEVTA